MADSVFGTKMKKSEIDLWLERLMTSSFFIKTFHVYVIITFIGFHLFALWLFCHYFLNK